MRNHTRPACLLPGSELRKVHFAEELNELAHLRIMESLGGDQLVRVCTGGQRGPQGTSGAPKAGARLSCGDGCQTSHGALRCPRLLPPLLLSDTRPPLTTTS